MTLPPLLWVLPLSLLGACAIHAKPVGVVDVEGTRVRMMAYNGDVTILHLTEQSEPIRYLDGCTLVVEGPKVGRRVTVNDWHIVDAGDGSGHFVGEVIARGARLMLADRNTQSMLVLEDDSAKVLRPYVGEVVLVYGPVVGGGVVQVMGYRVLAPPREER